MKTPKEKANELMQENEDVLSKHIFNGYFDIAQELAINTVKQIMRYQPYEGNFHSPYAQQEYWNNVIAEINAL